MQLLHNSSASHADDPCSNPGDHTSLFLRKKANKEWRGFVIRGFRGAVKGSEVVLAGFWSIYAQTASFSEISLLISTLTLTVYSYFCPRRTNTHVCIYHSGSASFYELSNKQIFRNKHLNSFLFPSHSYLGIQVLYVINS